MNTALNFIGGDPGAVKHGNFINYYQFHTSESRTKFLPKNVWKLAEDRKLVCLDVGCNSGDLTQEVYQFLGACMKERINNEDFSCYFLAIDLDPVLISRARESNLCRDNISYECLDVVGDVRDRVFAEYLKQMGKVKFDIVFCFSITMWIHLNHGDDGLRQFLVGLSQWTDTLVIEPQPWKCYRTAVRRLRRHGEHFPHYESIMLRDTQAAISTVLTQQCHFTEVYKSDQSVWDRTLVVYEKHKDKL